MLQDHSVTSEKHRLFVEARSGLSLPLSGALYWLGLGIAGFFLPDRTWCLAAFFTSGLIFPLGLALSKPLRSPLTLQSPLAGVILPALVPMGMSFAITIPAYFTNPALVPLALAVGMGLHWPVIGWMYDKTAAFTAHAATRTVLGVAIWAAIPNGRFTVLPLAVALVYAATFIWLLRKVRTAER